MDTERVGAPPSPFDLRSDVGRALAEVDWADSALGPWEQWPVSLSTAVRTMLGSRFSMCLLYGPESVFLCNDAYRIDTLGEKFPWALGKPMSTVWPEVWDVASDRIRSVYGGQATWDEGLQLFLERSGYTEETFHTFCYGPVHGDDGEVAGVLCVVTEDTLRVLADRRMALLRDLGAALIEATTRDAVAVNAFRQLSDDAPDLPFVVSYLNSREVPGLLELHWSAGAVAGGPAAPVRLSAGDDHPWAAAIFGAPPGVRTLVLDAGTDWPTGTWNDPPTQAIVLPLYQAAHHDPIGRLVVGVNPYRALDADYTGFVELLADQLASALTRADAFEQERDRHEQLAELDRAKTTFFTNISHELRTPLTLLLGPALDALNDSEHMLDEAQRRRVEVISRNGERLLKLVNTLLDFSRLEAGRMTARYEPLDLSRFTTELAAMFESAFERAGLTLEIACDALPQRPFVDREMWAKIVLNLLSNALKATFTGRVSVRLTDDPDTGGARLDVSDTGIGIPSAELEHLFERFHRVSGARQRSHEGSGIGLALVEELAGLHGGEVRVASTVGEGSTFTVLVPYGRAHLAEEQVAEEQAADPSDVSGLGAGYLAESLRWSAPADDTLAATPTVPDSDRRRVLVVDDSTDVREYVSGLLADDYVVTTARDGEEALAAVAAETPDLVVTDVMMPVLDGFGLLARLRADTSTAHIPVIMLSARSGDEATVEGLEAGADDYLVKPFSARELRARVRANLELDRVRRLLGELERSRDMLDNAERLARLGSWEVDLQEGTLRVSPQLARTSGIATDPTAPMRFDEAMSMTAPEDEARLRADMERVIAGGPDVDAEVWAVRTSGERFRARVRAVVIPDDDGRPRYLRGSTQDVTEQRAAEAELAAAHALREVAAREHAIAAELQRSLLPDEVFDAPQLSVASFYRAGVEGTQVGGDWYDVIDLGMGRTALVIGDVMGRGVRAAAVMGQLRAATRAYARLSLPPDEVLRLLDDTVREVGRDVIVTCVYAVYDPVIGVLDYANAGHPPPLVHVEGRPVARLAAGGPPLGIGRHGGIGDRVAFPAGAVLLLYTDGLVEQRGADIDARVDQLSGLLTSMLAQPADGGAAPALDSMPRALTEALLLDRADDDVALLVCRAGARTPDERDARYQVGRGDTVVGNARRFARETTESWGIDASIADDLQLAVSELVTNAITHGSRPVEMHLRLDSGRLRLAVRDGGDGRPVVRRSGPRAEHGRGLLLVTSVSEAWGVEGGTTGKTVWCEFAVGPLDGAAELAG